jgi:urocanate hydratase
MKKSFKHAVVSLSILMGTSSGFSQEDMMPLLISPTDVYIQTTQEIAYVIEAEDVGSGVLRYSISGYDSAMFFVDQETGVVRFKDAPSKSYRTNHYSFIAEISNGKRVSKHHIRLNL